MTTQKKLSTHTLTEAAIMVALSTVLSFITVYQAPFGGSVTLLSMAPIILLSIRHGAGVGLSAGFVHSVIQLIFGLSNVAYVPDLTGKILCILLDYTIPFTLLGLGGVFTKVRFTENERKNLVIASILGTLLVTLIRFACHFGSGVVIWQALTLVWEEGNADHIVNRYSAYMFSLIYNGWYMVPEIIETLVGVPILALALAKVKINRTK